MRGWRSYFRLLRNASRARPPYLLGPGATSRGSLATVENTTSSSGSSPGTGGPSKLASNTAGSGRGSWYLAHARPISRALQCYFKSLGLPTLEDEC